MKQKDLIEISIEMAKSFGKRELDKVFCYFSDAIVWIGPRESQYIEGRQRILSSYVIPETDIVITPEQIKAKAFSLGQNVTEVFLSYIAHGHIGKDKDYFQPQITRFTWNKSTPYIASGREMDAKLAICQIANPQKKDERDILYNIFGDSESQNVFRLAIPSKMASTIIDISGLNGKLYCYPASNIIYIQSKNEGHASLIHARDGNIDSNKSLAYYKKKYPDIFLSPHISYLVNPIYIKSIERFHLSLWDKTEIPIPEKKYTAFKDAFLKGER